MRICYCVAIGLFAAACSSTSDSNNTPNERHPASRASGGDDAGSSGAPDLQNPTLATPNSGVATSAPTTSVPLAAGLAIRDIAIYQGVKVPLALAGAPVAHRNAQVVAKRDGLVRVFVDPDSTYATRPVVAELVLQNGASQTVLRDQEILSASSTDADLSSTFNFNVPGNDIAVGTKYSVALREVSGATSQTGLSRAQYPNDGSTQSLNAQSTGATLHVKLVPVAYNADGTGRLPDTSAAQLALYRKAIYSLYPAADVDVTVRGAIQWPVAISAGGAGFSQLLQAMVTLREQDAAPPDVYYMGVFNPSDSFANYCAQGCVTGLSGLISDPDDATGRASIGIGFSGTLSAFTAAHEVGHAHGRPHAPCGGAADPDPFYPYASGGVGVWGYDITEKRLIDPSQARDVMGYCNPQWISDYNYEKLLERMAYVSGGGQLEDEVETSAEGATRFRFVTFENGSLAWGGAITLRRLPTNEPRTVEYVHADGHKTTATGFYYQHDHLPGGYFLIPEPSSDTTSVRIPNPSGGGQLIVLPKP